MIATLGKTLFGGAMDQRALIWGAIGLSVCFLLGSIYSAGGTHERSVQLKGIVIAAEQAQQVQEKVTDAVQKIEAKGFDRRARETKKVADAVAQIQNPSPEQDPVLLWASAIDGLRVEAGSGSPARFDGHAGPRHTSPLLPA